MSRKVREWLRELELYERTTHQDRVDIDKEIERRTGKYCDDAIEKKLITEKEFREIVELILKRKKKKKNEIPIIV